MGGDVAVAGDTRGVGRCIDLRHAAVLGMAIGASGSRHLLVRMQRSIVMAFRATGVDDAMPGIVTLPAVLLEQLTGLFVFVMSMTGRGAARHEGRPLLRLGHFIDHDQRDDQENGDDRQLGQPCAAQPVRIDVVDFRGA